jgi:L-threonylcarbamoyladenylate synthase
VRQGLGDAVDYILDGGPCEVGIESTVLSLAESTPILLRPGGISRRQIEKVIGRVVLAEKKINGAHASPGMHPRHYSPRTRLVLVRDGQVPASGTGAYLQLRCYAARLYSVLHALDVQDYDWIAVETPDATPEWEAVLDRLRRAASSQ